LSRSDVPDLSVLTPSRNYGRFIGDALASVAAQDLNYEHVVRDGASEDETVAVLQEWSGKVQWESRPDRGQSDALNKAFRASRGRWIAWLNADEFYLPGGLKRLMDVGDESGADIIYGDAVLSDGQGKIIRLFAQHGFSSWLLRRYGVFVATSAAIFRRSILGNEPLDPEMKRIMDWDLYLRLDAQGAVFRHVNYAVSVNRIHGDNVSLQPIGGSAIEYKELETRYGAHAQRVLFIDRATHAAYKLVSGAYRRQLAARRMRGVDLRWFRPEVGIGVAEQFLKRCYGVSSYGEHERDGGSRRIPGA
jgi:glycosyltransferase involved in cell wall biosynthesis